MPKIQFSSPELPPRLRLLIPHRLSRLRLCPLRWPKPSDVGLNLPLTEGADPIDGFGNMLIQLARLAEQCAGVSSYALRGKTEQGESKIRVAEIVASAFDSHGCKPKA
jgi:hypothetical protein